ncbi:MAG: acyl carrier protein [Saprospiraceae bacterium]|nr:acyl carrier protein [Saprospiraceae bacterium]
MEIAEKIISIIKENTECKLEIDPDTNFINELKIDSFGRLMIINAIEDEYSIEVDENDIENFKTVNQIVSALQLKYI